MFLYKIIGGQNFYQRKEIKDILCYLKTVNNSTDDIAVARIINVPKRGIGATSIGKAQAYAVDHNINLYNALELAYMNPELSRASAKIKKFTDFIEELREYSQEHSIKELVDKIIEDTRICDRTCFGKYRRKQGKNREHRRIDK